MIVPAEMRLHGIQSGAVNDRGPPRPSGDSTTAESITSSSIPMMQEKIPTATKKLFHMVVKGKGMVVRSNGNVGTPDRPGGEAGRPRGI